MLNAKNQTEVCLKSYIPKTAFRQLVPHGSSPGVVVVGVVRRGTDGRPLTAAAPDHELVEGEADGEVALHGDANRHIDGACSRKVEMNELITIIGYNHSFGPVSAICMMGSTCGTAAG